MLVYSIKRIFLAMLVALVVSAFSFGLLFLSGDPATAIAGEAGTEADIAYIRKLYGLDRPLPIQYIYWVGKAARGDFGKSFFFDLPVSRVIGGTLPTTMKLGALSLTFALVLSIPLGVIAAIRPNTWIDRLALTLWSWARPCPASGFP
jgi:peptide/nickel transport system permease protein